MTIYVFRRKVQVLDRQTGKVVLGEQETCIKHDGTVTRQTVRPLARDERPRFVVAERGISG